MSTHELKSKNQVVYEIIREAIINGEFEPGSRIVIDDLAIKYNVSHSPIRECLRLLEADGLVTIRPFAGVTVTDLRPELIMEVFALLESLEIISSCMASHHATENEFERLEKMIDQMEQHTDEADNWAAKNRELHMMIGAIANMTISRDMMERALLHWDRLRRYYLEEVFAQRVPQAQLEHRELLKALRSGEDEQIKIVIQQHNKAALNDYLDHIRKTQEVDI
ncbi:MAG: GntR family transcriptional regulator [Anaerolineae bacterium]|nr:GntR family transcriptional regulator [Anaerolineae bacterium]MCA9888737.1 GntR family transcriptional regulator [Anaerolineae bacterium]MCA9893020.1 GntR family transcriptional regulator [Anaerolineae bacterium]MCB9458505.1 GntR family transcriptional regulator [Anaerolineaceae bacterium]